jgi:hypothetical protein
VTRTVALLLQHVSAVVLIDPHLGKCRLTQRKLVVALAAEADENTHFEVYCVPLGVGENAKQGLRRNFEQLGQQSLRGSQKITVTVLSERVGGARFHNRYLLSRIGGVQFGDTIEASDGEDSLSALSVAKIKTLNRDYCAATTAFTIEDTFTVSA